MRTRMFVLKDRAEAAEVAALWRARGWHVCTSGPNDRITTNDAEGNVLWTAPDELVYAVFTSNAPMG